MQELFSFFLFYAEFFLWNFRLRSVHLTLRRYIRQVESPVFYFFTAFAFETIYLFS